MKAVELIDTFIKAFVEEYFKDFDGLAALIRLGYSIEYACDVLVPLMAHKDVQIEILSYKNNFYTSLTDEKINRLKGHLLMNTYVQALNENTRISQSVDLVPSLEVNAVDDIDKLSKDELVIALQQRGLPVTIFDK